MLTSSLLLLVGLELSLPANPCQAAKRDPCQAQADAAQYRLTRWGAYLLLPFALVNRWYRRTDYHAEPPRQR
ncbi:MAG: hypothetical protein MKZ95_11465, partial [Pirellulales bacterium]|nr:hypothetical protein [Pirellulales bacterium]